MLLTKCKLCGTGSVSTFSKLREEKRTGKCIFFNKGSLFKLNKNVSQKIFESPSQLKKKTFPFVKEDHFCINIRT